MNDADLIFQAMKMSSPKKKVRIIKEIEPCVIDTSDDAISKLAQKTHKPKRARPFRHWEPSDFFNYLVKALSKFDISLARSGTLDRDSMARLYDEFVRRLADEMKNEVMRDYLDWWVSTYSSKMAGEELYVNKLCEDCYIDRFIKIKFDKSKISTDPLPLQNSSHKDVDIDTLYTMGGLPMVLRSRGIVIAAKTLREKGEKNWLMRISQTLHDFPKNAVIATMNKTIEGKPYPPEDMIDFVSIARVATDYYGIKDYAGLDYKGFFKN